MKSLTVFSVALVLTLMGELNCQTLSPEQTQAFIASGQVNQLDSSAYRLYENDQNKLVIQCMGAECADLWTNFLQGGEDFSKTKADTAALEAELGRDSRKFLAFIGDRINTIVVGADNYGKSINGYLALSGRLTPYPGSKDDCPGRCDLVPFAAEIRQDGSFLVRVGALKLSDAFERSQDIWDEVRAVEFTYDNRNPDVVSKTLVWVGSDLKIPLLKGEKGKSYIAIATGGNFGLREVIVQVDDLESNETSVSSSDFMVDYHVGLAGRLGGKRLYLKGQVVFEGHRTDIDTSAPDENDEYSKLRDHSFLVNFAFGSRVGEKKQIELFYEGHHNRQVVLRQNPGNDLDLTDIMNNEPHRVGIKLKF